MVPASNFDTPARVTSPSHPAQVKDSEPLAPRTHGLSILLLLILIEVLRQMLSDLLSLDAVFAQPPLLVIDTAAFTLTLVLVGGAWVGWALRRNDWMHRLVFMAAIIGTAVLFLKVVELVATIGVRRDAGGLDLLQDSLLLWALQILQFAVLYWLVDHGGPHVRRSHPMPPITDFRFPQEDGTPEPWKSWRPNVFDYLFLSFVTASTWGPADTAVISRRAKSMVLVQVLISLAIMSIIAARAIGLVS